MSTRVAIGAERGGIASGLGSGSAESELALFYGNRLEGFSPVTAILVHEGPDDDLISLDQRDVQKGAFPDSKDKLAELQYRAAFLNCQMPFKY